MPYVTEENLTDVVLQRWQQIPDPRLRQIMQSMIKHLHGFVREIEPTEQEWFAAIDWLTRTGKQCTDKRQEFILSSDVLGVSMLVDAINHRLPTGATPTTVTGPFHIHDSPELATGAEGLYEAQRDVDEPWLRAIYRTGPDGSYSIRTVAPIGYTIPMDGTVGELMTRTSISHMRPAHVHFLVDAPGYERIVTHLFQNGDPYIETDVVYGVKKELIVDFQRMPPGRAPTGENVDTPFWVVRYDFALKQAAAMKLSGAAAS